MSASADLKSRLSDPDLLRESAPIAGRWLASSASGARFDVTDPATGVTLASVPDCGVAEAREAIAAADAARHEWAARTGKERAAVLRTWFDLMVAAADDLESTKILGQATRTGRRGSSGC